MTSPQQSPSQRLAEALGSGNPRRAAAEVERYVAYAIWKATGKQMPEPYVNNSRTTLTYGP